MADLGEAFNTLKFYKKPFQNIDFFFTQRELTEDHEFIDKNMNRKTRKVKVKHNFLALNIPTIVTTTTENGQSIDKPMGFDIEIYGDEGYHYKGTITSYQGIIPNFMVPIKADKKLFVNIHYKFVDSNNNSLSKKFVNFIEVPKRFQSCDDNDSHIIGKKDDESEIDV
jgi:hypothetical protein